MEFEWDPGKAAANLRKHRVSFEDAARVFLDPALLAVVYTVRQKSSDVIRLISARKADSHERSHYSEIQT